MPTAFIDQERLKELEDKLVASPVVQAVVGAGDQLAEKLRDVSGELTERATHIDPKAMRDKAQAAFASTVSAAFTTYGDLAARGKTILDQRLGGDAAAEGDSAPVTRPEETAKSTTAKSTAAKSKAAESTAAKSATAKKTSTAKKASSTTSTTAKKAS